MRRILAVLLLVAITALFPSNSRAQKPDPYNNPQAPDKTMATLLRQMGSAMAEKSILSRLPPEQIVPAIFSTNDWLGELGEACARIVAPALNTTSFQEVRGSCANAFSYTGQSSDAKLDYLRLRRTVLNLGVYVLLPNPILTKKIGVKYFAVFQIEWAKASDETKGWVNRQVCQEHASMRQVLEEPGSFQAWSNLSYLSGVLYRHREVVGVQETGKIMLGFLDDALKLPDMEPCQEEQKQ